MSKGLKTGGQDAAKAALPYEKSRPNRTGGRDRGRGAAERMRAYRKRRREAMRYVRIPLHVTEVDALIRIGRLKEDSRTDAEVIQAAVLSLVYQALGESEIGREMLRYV